MSEEQSNPTVGTNTAAVETPAQNASEITSNAQENAVNQTPIDPNPPRSSRPPIPEGMSKSQWKKQQRKKLFQERKGEFAAIRKQKKLQRREERRAKIKEYVERGEPIPEELKVKKQKVPEDQEPSGATFIIDCAFDDLMNDKEIVSMSSQITRAYSSNRFASKTADIKVTSFNGNLKKRFENELKESGWRTWNNVTFHEEPFEVPEDISKCVYLTADTDEVLETLEPDMTYIIGGIVDKNRHKLLCKTKADKLGIPTRRLPIDEFINLSGRQVLTTTHVVHLMLKYFETKNWKEAFESVLPQRKLQHGSDQEMSVQDEDDDDVEENLAKSEPKPESKGE